MMQVFPRRPMEAWKFEGQPKEQWPKWLQDGRPATDFPPAPMIVGDFSGKGDPGYMIKMGDVAVWNNGTMHVHSQESFAKKFVIASFDAALSDGTEGLGVNATLRVGAPWWVPSSAVKVSING